MQVLLRFASIAYPYYVFLIDMQTVTVSPKYQVVIPREIREQLGLKPGEKLQVFRVGNRVELMRVRPLEELYGMLPGLSTTVEDDPDRELSLPPAPTAKL